MLENKRSDNMRYKSTKFEIKAMGDNTFEGYASYFNNIDSYGDVITKGAFSKTLQENRGRIKILWQHDTSEPIGIPEYMEEDNDGLYVKGKISMTDTGKKAMILMRDGVVNEMSIGYDVIKDEYKNNRRYLKEIRLWEFSPVTFGANEKAKITGAKNLNELMFDMKYAKKEDLVYTINRLKKFLEEIESEQSTQTNDDSEQVQSILKMIRSFKNADTDS